MRRRLGTWALAYRLAWSASPGGVVGYAAVQGANRLLPGPLLALALGRIVDSLIDGRGPSGVWTAILVGCIAAPVALDYLWETSHLEVFEKTRHATNSTLLRGLTAPVSLKHLEDPVNADALAIVAAQPQAPGRLTDWLNAFVVGIPVVLFTMILLARIHVGLAVVALSALGLGPLHARARKDSLRFIDQTVPGQRLAARLFRMATERGAAKEIRLFGLGQWLADRHGRELNLAATTMLRAERRPLLLVSVAGVGQAVVLAFGLVLLLRLAVAGSISAGEVAGAVVLLAASLGEMFQLSMAGSDVARHAHVTEKLAGLLAVAADEPHPDTSAKVPIRLVDGLRLEGLSFTYPWSDRIVLADIDLHLPAGSVVAIVGENGAGKSTLVHLLLRFYDQDAGRILADGEDIRNYAAEDWRAAATAGFQDFARFYFLAREAVGVGQLREVADSARVERAAVEAGAEPFLSLLPDGLETQLGPHFDDGADLSEGQWQRVALARAAMREHPLLTILDEPTSALDPIAEEAVFRQYAARTVANRSIGGITLLISHRFSTVALADLIVVLHEGRVADVGSHTELIARDGLYAELYSLQASRYR